ncbi:DUF2283 domain-containing protein [Metabacillus indicus]|uniref:DUF2283 domain-containing protein n=1 Tax=Metabacillus indicus TaxID=246786 RepID=UPI002A0874FE|nr:DUF2283 domain-containing protein [Metabacillus indicus]MDX8290412.1 DUF2283 domain-containing protein [Metabacillus indicus]
MKAKLSYDSEADMGYVYLNANKEISIDLTEELEVNAFISIDIDKKKTIEGIELSADEAAGLRDLLYKGETYTKTDHPYLKTGHGFSLRISEKVVKSRYRVSEVTFCFAEDEYKGFIGIDLDIPEELS